MKVVGKLKCVRSSMCRMIIVVIVIVGYGEKENAVRTKYSLWWPLAHWALHRTNTSHP